MSLLKRVKTELILALIGAVLGLLIADKLYWPTTRGIAEDLPYPHVVPKTKDGVSLRFAMVHDVIHERFPKHGPDYYQERNRRTREALKEVNGSSSPREFELIDDLAVGLEMAGEHDAAIQLIRDKLKRQLALNLPRPQLYTSYSNLGTFLILGPFRAVRPGNVEDKDTLREGLQDIQTAIEINPDSHFGRERWQVAIIQYMLELYDKPDLLLTRDMVRNDLLTINEKATSPLSSDIHGGRWGNTFGGVSKARLAATYLKNPESWEETKRARQGITTLFPLTVESEGRLRAFDDADRAKQVPFDEPTLGIIGMWRLGGGAHPYFAVALGEITLRVGQNYIAWCAFERAARLANFAWPDPKLQAEFAAHCRRRQATIEQAMQAAEVAKLLPSFEAELAFGQDYQRAYQQYEKEQIAAGKSLDDPQFYAAFDAQRGPIASPVGDADWFSVEPPPIEKGLSQVELGLLLAGLFAMLGAWFHKV